MRERGGERDLVPVAGYGPPDTIYQSFLEGLDPTRQAMQEALATSTDPRFKAFLIRIMEPGKRKISLAAAAKACGIALPEFKEWSQNAAKQMAIGIAQRQAPRLMEHVAEDAMTREDNCERCDGLGWVSARKGMPDDIPGYRLLGIDEDSGQEMWIRTCPHCDGKKKIRRPGDTHSRDIVLEASGIVGKRAGMVLIQNFGGAGHSSAIDSLESMTLDGEFSEVKD